MSDLHERLYAAIDTDPLDVIPIAEELLARTMKAEATIERVRADLIEQRRATGITEGPWKRGAYAQACRTLRILSAAPESPTTEEETPNG